MMTHERMGGALTNPVLEAVRRVGGPTRAAVLCGTAEVTVYRWMRLRRIPRLRAAQALGRASRIPFDRLFGQADPVASKWGGYRWGKPADARTT